MAINKIKVARAFKAYFIRFKTHRAFGFLADGLIYFGYLLKLSKWVENNSKNLEYDDFYNGKVHHKNRTQLYQQFATSRKLHENSLTYLEFGVGHGNSLRWWSESNSHPQTDFWAFDTYEGLPEDYGSYQAGTFSMQGKFPDIADSRINFVAGLFQDTLLSTLPKIDFSKKVIVHIDGDLYSSALYPLSILFTKLKKGDIIIFDEFVVPLHEFRAFCDFLGAFYVELKPIGAINNYLQVIFEITQINNQVPATKTD